MRLFTPFVFLPALILLLVCTTQDQARGDGQLGRAVMIGFTAGLLAAFAYDVFRLPFVFAKEWGITSMVPPLNLFKVFPRFGAMVLGQSIEQTHYSVVTQTVGWIYHFSNGATFGVMYLAIIGDASRRHWLWAVLFALAVELAMLLTPYPNVFNITMTTAFVVATVVAHSIFGASLGFATRRLSRASKPQFGGSTTATAA